MKKTFTTENIDTKEFTGVIILLGDEVVARIEQSTDNKETNCYVYGSLSDEDFTHKINIK